MTDFLEVTLTKSMEFRCDFKAEIYGIYGESIFYPSIRQSGIKIDTGAHGILIPLRTLCWTNSQIQNLLDDAIKNHKVACPENAISNNYLMALNQHFGINRI